VFGRLRFWLSRADGLPSLAEVPTRNTPDHEHQTDPADERESLAEQQKREQRADDRLDGRGTPPKNRKFASTTPPAASAKTYSHAALVGGGAGACPASGSTIARITTPPNASQNSIR